MPKKPRSTERAQLLEVSGEDLPREAMALHEGFIPSIQDPSNVSVGPPPLTKKVESSS